MSAAFRRFRQSVWPSSAPRASRLRARLILLVVLAAAPAVLMLGLQTLSAYREARALAHERGLFAVRVATATYGSALRTAEMLLAIAANLPAVSAGSPSECSDALSRVFEGHNSRRDPVRFSAIFLALPSGDVVCSNGPVSDELSFGDRAYFQNALRSKEFVAGEHVMGRHSAELLIPVALPKSSPEGVVSAVLVTGLRLDWLGRASVLQPPSGGVVTVLDESGVILARSEDHGAWVGRPHPWAKLIEPMLDASGEGFAERPGADGVERLFTLKRIEIGPNKFFLMVGYEAANVFMPARESLTTGFALVAIAGVLLLGAAVYGSRRFIGEPVSRLSDAANRMSKGDLSVRVAVSEGSELAELGTAFNDMAAGLQNRASELAEANEMLSAIVNSSPFAIFVVDAETTVLSWNAAAEQIYGWFRDEIVGCKFPAVPEDQRQSFLALRSQALGGEMLQYEAERVRKDGRRIRVRCTAAALRSRDGALSGTVYIAEDVTERRSLEQQLVQAQKMEAVGQLTGGIAHDFNNLLQVILGCAELSLERLQADDHQRPIAEMMFSAAERGASLTRQLLAFSRRQALEPELIDANEVVRNLEPMLRRTLGEAIVLETQLAPGLGSSFVDRGQLETALVNLAVNARDAMPSGGRLIIETSNVELDADYAARRVEVTPGEYIMIGVSDTGAGMPEDVLSRIFEPFFTTKPVGKGTGLGLSMVFGFIKQSKGHVSAYSEVGHGATLRLYLPRSAGAPGIAAAPADEPEAVPSGRSVLYVEDDPEVRKFGMIQLSALGYRVIEAASPREALAVLAGPELVDLLFTDVVLGADMNGWELSERAQGMRPGIRVLFASGYNESVIIRDGLLKPGVQLLRKPYRRVDLARKLGELFNGETDRPL